MRFGASGKLWVGGVLCASLIFLLFCIAIGDDGVLPKKGRPDLVQIEPQTGSGRGEMPAVSFLHDKHTEALKGQDCTTCHVRQTDNARLKFAFKKAERAGNTPEMDFFHANCIGCHTEIAAKGTKSGPTEGQCRLCHVASPEIVSSRQPIPFDRSLHYRHEANRQIKSLADGETGNCSACHHDYDAALKKTVFSKGNESSCTYCHGKPGHDPARPMKAAAHDACVACHVANTGENQKSGPITCAGCHDASQQAKIQKVENPPRLKRGQPDAVLMAARYFSQKPASGEAIKPPAVAGVAFNHKAHEGSVADCKSCHHSSLQKCATCHTPDGAPDGKFIRLEQAMHDTAAGESCMGCHQIAQKAMECAGCHGATGKEAFSQRECGTCHSVTNSEMAGWVGMDEKKRAARASELTSPKMDIRSLLPDSEIPEIVTIGVMADQYKPASFPHRKIVHSLADRMDGNKLAKAFHSKPDTLCQGCHHNSPITPRPAACISCHGKTETGGSDNRPALMAAYHNQCMTCHQKMGIEKPAATDCTACHPGRDSAGAVTSAKN
mgnify:CR=1 FL=1